MRQPLSDHLRHEIERFDPDVAIERAWTPPRSWYRDPELYALEAEVLFPRTWQPVARLADLAEPGAYVAGRDALPPWVVVRGRDGELGAFHNVCRHKGREVVIGRGQAERFVCGYHAWSYRLDGSLDAAPRIAGIEDFDRQAMALPPLAVEARGEWAFVNGDPAAAQLAGRLPYLSRLLDERGWERLRFAARKEWDIACNWKVYVDNYLDGGYHIPHMHPTLDAQLDMASYRTELHGECSIQTSRASAETDDRLAIDPAARIGSGAIYAWIYPSFMLNRYGPCLDTNYVIPVAPDRCRVVYEFYFDESGGAEARDFVAASIAQADVTQREDIEICESVQAGLASPSYDRGRYAPRVEQGEHHFHQLLARTLRSALGR